MIAREAGSMVWEYKMKRLGGKVSSSELQRQCDELGAEGWELVGFTPVVELKDESVSFDRHSPGCLMVFKKASARDLG
ncbi:DUF4177 domain-containing protein [Nonomuraea sp. NPDC050680]|uniref:DUF4177 domain-containing protein n=1 Tax=Nonomuraea sp. NPDC050680 TaxID=3154630 RepID=UPI0033D1E967